MREQLKREIGPVAVALLTVGTVIGSGIFGTPAAIARLAGSSEAIMAVWIIGGLVTLCLALCLAELAAMFPRPGGIYIYLQEAFGPKVAFVYGWTYLLVNPANWAAIAVIFASYLGTIVPMSATGERIAASLAIAVAALVNIASVRVATRFTGVFTAAKILALLAVAGGILLFHEALPDGPAMPSPVVGMSAFGLALILVLWPYEGVASITSMAGEVRDPGRSMPRGLIAGVAMLTGIYLLVNIAYLHALGASGVAASRFVAVDAMQVLIGSQAASVIAACAVIATAGALLASAMSDPRVFYAMATDRLFFRQVAKVHPRLGTPHVAIALSALLAIMFLWVRTFEQLAAQFILGMWLFYSLTIFALIWLRRTRPDLARPYRVPLYPVLPVVFLLACIAMLVNAFVDMPYVTLANLAVVALGFPVYAVWTRAAARGDGEDKGLIG